MPEPIARSFTVDMGIGPRGDYDGDYVGGPSQNYSEVRDPNNPDAGQRNIPRQRPPTPIEAANVPVGTNPGVYATSATFDPEFGYIVGGEDDGVLIANGLNPKQRETLRGYGKLLSEKDADQILYEERCRKVKKEFEKEIQGLGPAELDSFMRFDDLAL